MHRNWKLFRDSGMLWWTNRILHTFGWSIFYDIEEDGTILDVYPGRSTWVGFSEDTNTKRMKDFKTHILDTYLAPWKAPAYEVSDTEE